MIGVSKRAQRILKNQPSKIIFPMVPNSVVSKKMIPTTIVVSMSCDIIVEKLFRNHRCLPLVRFFQKWKIRTSMSWANK